MAFCVYLAVDSGATTRFFPVVPADVPAQPDQVPVMYLNLVASGAASPEPPTVTLAMEASADTVIPFQGGQTELDSPTIAGFLGVAVTYDRIGPAPGPGAGESRFQLAFFLVSGSLEAIRSTVWSIRLDANADPSEQSFSWTVTDRAEDAHTTILPVLAARRARVTGPLTVDGALEALGGVSATDVTLAGSCSVEDTLRVMGAATLQGPLDAGSTAIRGTLEVTGTTAIGGDASIGGPLALNPVAFTAANATSPFVAFAHFLATGDGPVRVDGGFLPRGLAAATDYWVIALNANSFKLAASLALALAGSPVTITSNGEGTLSSTTATLRPRNLTATRDAAVGNDLGVTGNASIGGSLGVLGTTTISADASIGGPLVLSPIGFVAVNAPNWYVAVAHGLRTGDGPVRVANTGGALPDGLSAATDYWVIGLTADSFQLAASLPLALAGTAIDITSNGTGTHTLTGTGSTKRRGDLAVLRNAAIGGTLTVTGTTTLGDLSTTRSAIVGTDLTVTGNALARGTLDVTGLVTARGDVTAPNVTATTSLRLPPVAALTAGQDALFTSSANNELYWRSHNGTNIQLTSGSALNFQQFKAGFGGDYASAGAAVNFNDFAKTYLFLDGAGNLAKLNAKTVGVTNASGRGVALTYPETGGSTYNVTFPASQPTATAVVQMDVSGTLSASPAAAVATGPVTVAANQSVTVSGTGDYKHGTRTLQLGALSFLPTGGTALTYSGGNAQGTQMAAAVPLRVGDRLLAVRVRIMDVSGTTVAAFLNKSDTIGSSTNIATSPPSSGTGGAAAIQILAIPINTTVTLAAGSNYFVAVVRQTGAGNVNVGTLEIDYDRL